MKTVGYKLFHIKESISKEQIIEDSGVTNNPDFIEKHKDNIIIYDLKSGEKIKTEEEE